MVVQMNKIISINEFCQLSGKSRTTVWRWTKKGILPKPIKLGPNSVGFLQADIEVWLESKRLVCGDSHG
jgi:prophage regulatory protein